MTTGSTQKPTTPTSPAPPESDSYVATEMSFLPDMIVLGISRPESN